jgi:putative transcriptional regulator
MSISKGSTQTDSSTIKGRIMKKRSALEFNPDRMIAELGQLVADQKKGNLAKYRITQVEVAPLQPMTASEILRLREQKLQMSRGALAKILNIPQTTLRAWEDGKRNPSGAAVRLLDLVNRMPQIAFSCLHEQSNSAKRNPVKPSQANPHRGSDFDNFLKEQGIYEEVTASASKKAKMLYGNKRLHA